MIKLITDLNTDLKVSIKVLFRDAHRPGACPEGTGDAA
jgi:hypothetical protein